MAVNKLKVLNGRLAAMLLNPNVNKLLTTMHTNSLVDIIVTNTSNVNSAEIRIWVTDGPVEQITMGDIISYGRIIEPTGEYEKNNLRCASGESIVVWTNSDSVVVRVSAEQLLTSRIV